MLIFDTKVDAELITALLSVSDAETSEAAPTLLKIHS